MHCIPGAIRVCMRSTQFPFEMLSPELLISDEKFK